jgi:hypothetical protein
MGLIEGWNESKNNGFQAAAPPFGSQLRWDCASTRLLLACAECECGLFCTLFLCICVVCIALRARVDLNVGMVCMGK